MFSVHTDILQFQRLQCELKHGTRDLQGAEVAQRVLRGWTLLVQRSNKFILDFLATGFRLPPILFQVLCPPTEQH
jgi:hypothetical protein